LLGEREAFVIAPAAVDIGFVAAIRSDALPAPERHRVWLLLRSRRSIILSFNAFVKCQQIAAPRSYYAMHSTRVSCSQVVAHTEDKYWGLADRRVLGALLRVGTAQKLVCLPVLKLALP